MDNNNPTLKKLHTGMRNTAFLSIDFYVKLS